MGADCSRWRRRMSFTRCSNGCTAQHRASGGFADCRPSRRASQTARWSPDLALTAAKSRRPSTEQIYETRVRLHRRDAGMLIKARSGCSGRSKLSFTAFTAGRQDTAVSDNVGVSLSREITEVGAPLSPGRHQALSEANSIGQGLRRQARVGFERGGRMNRWPWPSMPISAVNGRTRADSCALNPT